MNIKQAPCMARIVAPGHRYNQWFVSVVGKAPRGSFDLPDGHPAINGDSHPSWICESFMRSLFDAPLDTGGRRQARFAVINDANLRPIDDTPGDEEFVTEARKSLTTPKVPA